MAGGKTNTQRIESLETQAADLSARLDVIDKTIEGIDKAIEGVGKLLSKCSEAAEGHGSKIIVIEQQVLLITDLKAAVAAIAPLKEELVAVRKDIESLQNWKAEQKKEKEEGARRLWAFGPSITAALISGFITLVGLLINFGLNRAK